MTRPRLLSFDTLLFALSAAFAAAGLYGAARGKMSWWPAIFFGANTIVFVLSYLALALPMGAAYLEVSAWGVRHRRTFGPTLLAKKAAAVSWDALSKVEIMTDGGPPAFEDMYFLFHGSDGSRVVVRNAIAAKHGLIEELQRRLPGFDNEAVVAASGCITCACFLVWQRGGSKEAGHG